MKDRLEFQKTVLSNGITIWSQYQDIPFVLSRIIFPFGHAHNTGEILPGSFHFLEHLLLNRSKGYPQKGELGRNIVQHGGYVNGYTSEYYTQYLLNSVVQRFQGDFTAQVSQLFDPYILDEDIAIESVIIANERDSSSKWFPFQNESSKYLHQEWMAAKFSNPTQTFGDDASLGNMTLEKIKLVHKNYFCRDLTVIVVGKFDLNLICATLENITTQDVQIPPVNNKISWVNNVFHAKKISDIKTYHYLVGGFHETDVLSSCTSYHFLNLIGNHYDGILTEKFRNEKGILYGVNNIHSVYPTETIFSMGLSLNLRENVSEVRNQLAGLIETTIGDEVRIARYKEREILSEVFDFSSPQSIINYACRRIYKYGTIHSESELRELFDHAVSKETFLSMYHNFTENKLLGECLLVPLDE